MTWFCKRLRRRSTSHASRIDTPPARLVESRRARAAAEQQLRRVRAQEPSIGEVAAELRTLRQDNHIPERLAALWREGKRA